MSTSNISWQNNNIENEICKSRDIISFQYKRPAPNTALKRMFSLFEYDACQIKLMFLLVIESLSSTNVILFIES